jgi:hypothetical protein
MASRGSGCCRCVGKELSATTNPPNTGHPTPNLAQSLDVGSQRRRTEFFDLSLWQALGIASRFYFSSEVQATDNLLNIILKSELH